MKRCRACGIEKDIFDFYKLPGTKDGHDSKCIDCVKLSMQQLYKKNSQDPQWVEKERERGKEKYHRLGYLDSEWNRRKNDLFWITSEYKGLRRWVSKKIVITDTEEIHHWNYLDAFLSKSMIVNQARNAAVRQKTQVLQEVYC